MIKGKIRFLFFTKSNSNHFINQKILNIKKNQLKKVATKLNHMSNNIRLQFNKLHLEIKMYNINKDLIFEIKTLNSDVPTRLE
jgi:hypothetical protein